MAPLLTIDAALECVLARARALPTEVVELDRAAGRVLAEPAAAQVDLPSFPSSAMDGFAVRSVDTPGRLPVVARIAAGRPAGRSLGPGEAMAIATGGVVPEGADAVVPVEYVVPHDNEVEIPKTVGPGANVRSRGGDVGAGDLVVPAGVRLGAAQLGALAAAGLAELVCRRRPRAAVLATGSELRRPGEELRPGEVYEANGLMVAAALTAAGADVERLPAVADDPEHHRAALTRGLEFDVLVTTGGVSVGPHDLVRSIGAELGIEEVFWGVAVKPGKPVTFGVSKGTLVFGLPGNPVSSLVGFELFVRPAVLALQGLADPGPRYEVGVLARPAPRNVAREQLLRARSRWTGDALELELLDGQESHMIARAAVADTLVRIARGEGDVPAGSPVPFLRL